MASKLLAVGWPQKPGEHGMFKPLSLSLPTVKTDIDEEPICCSLDLCCFLSIPAPSCALLTPFHSIPYALMVGPRGWLLRRALLHMCTLGLSGSAVAASRQRWTSTSTGHMARSAKTKRRGDEGQELPKVALFWGRALGRCGGSPQVRGPS